MNALENLYGSIDILKELYMQMVLESISEEKIDGKDNL